MDMPALWATDPGDLVLGCSLLKVRREDKLLAIMNDYRVVEMTDAELLAALQRTYAYIGGTLSPRAPATQKAARPPSPTR